MPAPTITPVIPEIATPVNIETAPTLCPNNGASLSSPDAARQHALVQLWQRVDRQGLGYVAGVYSVSRALILVATAVAAHLSAPGIFMHPTPTPFWRTWFYWDASYYANIARVGYRVASIRHDPAFFPLFPLSARLFVPITHGNYMLACFYAANVAWFVALYMLYRLARHDFNQRVARGAVIALSVFPTAFFGFVPYPEALFLALSIGAVLCIRQGKWGQAALWGMFASQTRLAGVMLMIPFLWEYAAQHGVTWRTLTGWRGEWHRPRWRLPRADILWVLLIPTGTLLYMLWLWHAVGDPLAFIHAEKSWHREMRFPLASLWDGMWVAIHTKGYISFRAWQEFMIVAVMMLVALLGSRVMPASYAIFSLSLMALFLISTPQDFPLESQSRYLLEIFPLFIILGVLAARRRWAMGVICAAGLPLQLVLVGIFSRSGWMT